MIKKVDISSLKKCVIEAGNAIMEVKKDGISTNYKDDMSPVTQADEAAENIIIKELKKIFPDIKVISEENKESHSIVPSEQFFLVDPLDGTKEFIRPNTNGYFTVNVGLIENKSATAGIIYAPMLKKLFWGDVRNGAKMLFNGKENTISIREVPNSGPVALASRSHLDSETETFLSKEKIIETKNIGSSLKFALLACGDADIYPRFGPTMEWDTAAGEAILKAAGGNVFFLDGKKHFYGKASWKNDAFLACGGYFPNSVKIKN